MKALDLFYGFLLLFNDKIENISGQEGFWFIVLWRSRLIRAPLDKNQTSFIFSFPHIVKRKFSFYCLLLVTSDFSALGLRPIGIRYFLTTKIWWEPCFPRFWVLASYQHPKSNLGRFHAAILDFLFLIVTGDTKVLVFLSIFSDYFFSVGLLAHWLWGEQNQLVSFNQDDNCTFAAVWLPTLFKWQDSNPCRRQASGWALFHWRI